MNIATLIEHIDLGQLALPEFQRGYVWNRDQVRQLMTSLYRRYPVGSLLVWTTVVNPTDVRGDKALPPLGTVDLLLDGQQRMTSLYGVVRGWPPKFFQGNSSAFRELKFNIQEESFEFWQPVKMRDNPVWFDVTAIMKSQDVSEDFESQMISLMQDGMKPMQIINRLSRVQSIKNVEFHIERISGEDKNIDVVVDIFNRVNSGGTRLSKGDLALAKICAQWPQARDRMNQMLKTWEHHGYFFKLDWLLRCVTTVAANDALFSSLDRVSTDEFKDALEKTETYINRILNLLSGRLGIDHSGVLKGVYAIPLMTRYLHSIGGSFADKPTQDKLLYWYLHVALWGRYSGSTETALNQDLRLIDNPDGALDRLIAQLRQTRGDLRIRPEDFQGSTTGSRFYPFLYVLTRVYDARDLNTGLPIKHGTLGKGARLELHHIFPKARLYKYGEYSRMDVNAVANFMFQTQTSNLQITDRHPREYFETFERDFPGVLASQWIPQDPSLWEYDRYLDFLDARRQLLAEAANQFLDGLLAPSTEKAVETQDTMPETGPNQEEGGVAITDEDTAIEELRAWLEGRGLPAGERHFELAAEESGELLARFDVAWPEGLQTGLSQPAALLLDEPEHLEAIANEHGFRYFTSIEELKEHVEFVVMAAD